MTHHHSRSAQAWPPIQRIAQQVNDQVNRGNLRVGDAERDEAARDLGEHFAQGRIDRDEYDERLEQVFAARTGADLAAVFRDLPQPRAAYSRPARSPHGPGHGPWHGYDHGHAGFRFPFLPVLLVLIGTAIAFGAPWIVWAGLGVMLLTRKFQWERRRRTAHRSSQRPAWS